MSELQREDNEGAYQVKKYLVSGIILISLISLSTGCVPKKIVPWQKEIPKPKPKSRLPAHTISEQTQKKIVSDAYQNLKTISRVTTDVSLLKKAMAGEALRDMTRAIQKDLKAGRVKKRVYAETKITFENYTKGVAGVTAKFLDKSYYVDRKTGQPLSDPKNVPQRFALALKKVGGQWKIIRVLAEGKTPTNK